MTQTLAAGGLRRRKILMKTKPIGTATLLTICSFYPSFAGVGPEPDAAIKRQVVATEKSTAKSELPDRVRRKAADTPVSPITNADVFEGIIIQPGKTISLDSTLDYSTATSVAVGIQCIVCDSLSESLGTSGLVLLARWAVPNAELYVTTENKATTLFPYWDAGGVIFNVYGSMFRLSLQNNGSEPIAIEQIIILRRGS